MQSLAVVIVLNSISSICLLRVCLTSESQFIALMSSVFYWFVSFFDLLNYSYPRIRSGIQTHDLFYLASLALLSELSCWIKNIWLMETSEKWTYTCPVFKRWSEYWNKFILLFKWHSNTRPIRLQIYAIAPLKYKVFYWITELLNQPQSKMG